MDIAAIEKQYQTSMYPQEGEDWVLRRLFCERTDGFYVDVGAHHPIRFSNTYAFYKRGWRGMNMDATAGSMAAFNQYRPDDINVECLISEKDDTDTDSDVYNEPAINSGIVGRRSGNFETIKLRSHRLETILKDCLPRGQKIDLLTVDVEGMDLDVLRSNDWNTYRPRLVLAESCINLANPQSDSVVSYMTSIGYDITAFLYTTAFFIQTGENRYNLGSS